MRTEAGEDASERNDAGEVVGAGEVSVTRLRVGDCVELGAELSSARVSGTTVESLVAVPCSASHQGEVIFVDDEFQSHRTSSPIPTLASTKSALVACTSQLDAYTGVPYETTALDVIPLMGTDERLLEVDSGLTCIAVTRSDTTEAITTTTGTLRAPAGALTRPAGTLEMYDSMPVGTCVRLDGAFDDPSTTAIPPVGRVVPCTDPHHGEVVHNVPDWYEAFTTPPTGLEGFDDCIARLEEYTGEPFDASPFDIIVVVPNDGGAWDLGSRSLTCIGVTLDPAGSGAVVETSTSMRTG